MSVFVIGATGFIGSAIVREVIEAGHQVLGPACSDAPEAKVTSAGAEVHAVHSMILIACELEHYRNANIQDE